jgi:hypothetical protein
MTEKIPDDIKNDLARAFALHQRATSDYAQCIEFSKLMVDLLARLEDAGCSKTADKVMGILLDCNPKDGSSCDKATHVGEKMKKFRTNQK